MLTAGDPVPSFRVRGLTNPNFAFDSVAGRHIVLTFVPSFADPVAAQFFDRLHANRGRFDDLFASHFMVTADPQDADRYDGGDLRFPEFGMQTYRPPTGGAVVFSCSLLHEVLPVTRGQRFAVLPFLYDEAAAALRLENARHLQDDALREGVLRSVAPVSGS